jgi:hypothetical protein
VGAGACGVYPSLLCRLNCVFSFAVMVDGGVMVPLEAWPCCCLYLRMGKYVVASDNLGLIT